MPIQEPPSAHQYQKDAEEISTAIVNQLDPRAIGYVEAVSLLARCLLRFSVNQLGEWGGMSMDGTENLFGRYALPEIGKRREDPFEQRVLATFVAGNIAITLGYYRILESAEA